MADYVMYSNTDAIELLQTKKQANINIAWAYAIDLDKILRDADQRTIDATTNTITVIQRIYQNSEPVTPPTFILDLIMNYYVNKKGFKQVSYKALTPGVIQWNFVIDDTKISYVTTEIATVTETTEVQTNTDIEMDDSNQSTDTTVTTG